MRQRGRDKRLSTIPDYAKDCAYLWGIKCEACTNLECVRDDTRQCPYFKTHTDALAGVADSIARGGAASGKEYAQMRRERGHND